jgi:hypothetical protein
LSIYVEARGHRHVRRVMVFASADNPVWKRLSSLERQAKQAILTSRLRPPADEPDEAIAASAKWRSPSKPYDLLGVSRPVFTKWQYGEAPNVSNAYGQIRALHNAVKDFGKAQAKLEAETLNLCDRLDAFLESAVDDEPVRDSGVKLGYRDENDVRQALDRLFHRAYPLFKRPWASADAAKNELRHLQGLHCAWMKRGRDMYLRCTMDFRYAVSFREGHAIRVKLDVPMISGGRRNAGRDGATPGHAAYDGWIMLTQAARIFLTFETRSGDARSDFVFMIIDNWPRQTDTADEEWRTGSYLTADQDNDKRAASAYLLMRRAALDEDISPRKVVRGSEEFLAIERQATQLGLEEV